MHHPNPILVLVLLSLVGSVGLEYGLGSMAVATTPESQPPMTVPDGADATAPPSQRGEESAFIGSSSTASSETPVRMEVERIDTCGPTCREVTAQLHNDGLADLTNVEVFTTIYAGDEIVWVDAERVGTISAGETYTTTKRVQIGPGELLKIQSNDGMITVKTVVEFDQGSTVITEDISVV